MQLMADGRADAAISAVPYFLNVGLARASIKAGVSFCDMGGNTDVVQEELSFDEEAESAGVSVIPDCGLAPGLGNVLVADACALKDEAHRITAMMRTTAYPVSVIAQMQARGEIARKGALPPESAILPGPFLEALSRRGIAIHQREIVEGPVR